MDNFEITTIQVRNVPEVVWLGYDKLMTDIVRLVEQMKTVEVTEETIKENKRLLAQVRKEFAKIDNERKQVKKQILAPYQDLETKVKDLQTILREGETAIDAQIKAYTAREREERKQMIAELFDKYHVAYSAPRWLSFEKFISMNPTLVTNKSTSNKTLVATIVGFFERYKEDYTRLKKEVPIKDSRTAILISYQRNGFNMDEALEDYRMMIAEKERLQKLQDEAKKQRAPKLRIIGEDDEPDEKPIEYVNIRIKRDDLEKIKNIVDFEIL